ncbi:MAG TPA: hypothetical protein VHM30_05830 [Gemmatimonadaceae bacterium]|nr:hypothetical protein [Gemmatimonadaceae bacterium]
MPPVPPYALAPAPFRFRALAQHAGRAALGGPREATLACYVVARLAVPFLPGNELPAEDRATRASAARTWLASLALPAPLRAPLTRAIDASRGEAAAASAALVTVAEAAASYLDGPALAELRAFAAQLGPAVP